MTIWIIGVVLYLLIGYGVAGGLHPDRAFSTNYERSMRKKARRLALFGWPMEVGFLIGTVIRYFVNKVEAED